MAAPRVAAIKDGQAAQALMLENLLLDYQVPAAKHIQYVQQAQLVVVRLHSAVKDFLLLLVSTAAQYKCVPAAALKDVQNVILEVIVVIKDVRTSNVVVG